MSADLFAEFGGFSESQDQRKQPTPISASVAPANAPSGPGSFFPGSSPALGAEPQAGFASSSWQQPIQPQQSLDFFSSTVQVNQNDQPKDPGDDDAWGDFEVAEVAPPAPAPAWQPQTVPSHPRPSNAQAPASRPPPVTRIVRASTMDLITNNLVDIGLATGATKQSRPVHESPKPVQQMPKAAETKPKRPSDPSVLFDADDYDGEQGPGSEDEDEDEFGDFESTPAQLNSSRRAVDLLAPTQQSGPAVASKPTATATDLLSDLSWESPAAVAYPQPPKSPSFQQRNPFPGLEITTPVQAEFPKDVQDRPPSPVTVWPSFGSDAGDGLPKKDATTQQIKSQPEKPGTDDVGWEWDTADAAPEQPASSSQQVVKPAASGDKASARPSDAGGWTVPLSTNADSDVSGPAPTNIPPPSILLAILPQLLDLADSALLKPLGGHAASIRDRVLSDPKTVDFLRGYLLLATVAARIMAGRKLRWHRDKFLSQSMSISAAGGRGGMKLAGIDRAQASREDREAADVLAAWGHTVGPLRAAVAAANAVAGGGQGLKVPELSATMAVQTVKGAEKAPRQCFLCGLKRDERVARVDFDVEDIFHEWWIDHWGHRACRNFWLEHEPALRQR